MKDCYTNIEERAFTLIEVIIVAGIITVLVAIVIPHLLRTRINANESQVKAALKTIATAEVSYRISHNIYASLADLGSSAGGPAYIDRVLGCESEPCNRSGYQFSSSDISRDTFHCTATAISNTSGLRSYCVTEDGLVRMDLDGGLIVDHDTCRNLTAIQQ